MGCLWWWVGGGEGTSDWTLRILRLFSNINFYSFQFLTCGQKEFYYSHHKFPLIAYLSPVTKLGTKVHFLCFLL